MDIPHLFICSSINGHLGCLHLLTIVNNAALNMSVQISVWVPFFNSLGHISRNQIARSYGNLQAPFLTQHLWIPVEVYPSMGIREPVSPWDHMWAYEHFSLFWSTSEGSSAQNCLRALGMEAGTWNSQVCSKTAGPCISYAVSSVGLVSQPSCLKPFFWAASPNLN